MSGILKYIGKLHQITYPTVFLTAYDGKNGVERLRKVFNIESTNNILYELTEKIDSPALLCALWV